MCVRSLPLLAVLLACTPSTPDPVDPAPASDQEEAAEDKDDPSPVASGASDPSAPGIASAEVPSDPGERIAASHILVAYKGALRAKSKVKRTRSEAEARAAEALDRLKAGEDFVEVAREMSDDSTNARGGFLGSFGRGAMQKDFEEAAFSLPIGGLSAVVETPYGFHIIQRQALEEIHVAHILVQWKEIPHTKATRTRDEALVQAETALARVRAGEPFADVAKALSDGPTAVWGGDLGVLTRGQMVPAFDAVAFALKPGQSSGIVESPLGFHLIQRAL